MPPKPHEFTAEELELLTEEELAGIEDEDLLDDPETGDEELAADDDNSAFAPDKDGELDVVEDDGYGAEPTSEEDADRTEADADAAATEAADAAKAIADLAANNDGDADGDKPDADDEDDSITSPLDFELSEDHQEKVDEVKAEIQALKERQAELRKQNREGEITDEEFDAEAAKFPDQLEDLAKKQSNLEWEENKAELAVGAKLDTWYKKTVPDFLADKPIYKASGLANQLLDKYVREEQERTGRNFSPKNLLAAHKKVMADVQALTGKPVEEPAPDKDADKGDKKPKTPPKQREIPPSLNSVPAVDISETDDGKFAHLSRLSGVDFENALERLSPADREAYLASGD